MTIPAMAGLKLMFFTSRNEVALSMTIPAMAGLKPCKSGFFVV